jgi:acetyl-CoA carboxylase carboxyltransferase component
MFWIKAKEAKEIVEKVKTRQERIEEAEKQIGSAILAAAEQGKTSFRYRYESFLDEDEVIEIITRLKRDGYEVKKCSEEIVYDNHGLPFAPQTTGMNIYWNG